MEEKLIMGMDTKMTKTYSITVGDVIRIKKAAERLGVSDAEALHRAVELLTAQTFPEGYQHKDAGNG